MLMPTEFKRGMTILFKGVVHEILNVEHVRPGKGGAFARVKMKNLDTQSVIEENFSSKEKVEQVITEKKFMEYLYRDKDLFYLMDKDTYEQIPVGKDKLERIIPYLRENETVTLVMYKDKIIDVEYLDHINLKVVKADPGLRGDTATGGTKPVTLETGLVIQVPLFINEGDVIRVDTRTGAYIQRV